MRTASGFTSYGDVEFTRLSVLWPLEVRVLEGSISADLMPAVPPDPIDCRLSIELRNLSGHCGLAGLAISSTAVLRAKDDAVLGNIRFNPIPSIDLAPLEADTIEVNKIEERAEIFPPPCDLDVYLMIKLRDAAGRTYIYRTQSFYFECTY